MRRSRSAPIALIYVLLLLGAECARIHDMASTKTAIGLSFHGHKIKPRRMFGGGEVCRKQDLADEAAAIYRYHYKMKKMKDLSTYLGAHPLSLFSLPKWVELKGRWQNFESCAVMLADSPSEVPFGLITAMSSGKDALESGVREPMRMVLEVVRSNNVFEQFEDLQMCRYDPTALNIKTLLESNNTQEEMRTQLFGSACNKLAAQEYVDRLDKRELAMVERLTSQLQLLIGLRHQLDEGKSAIAKDDEPGVDEEALTRQAEEFFSSLISHMTAIKRGSVKVFGKDAADDADSIHGYTNDLENLPLEDNDTVMIRSSLLEFGGTHATGSQQSSGAKSSKGKGKGKRSIRRGSGRRNTRLDSVVRGSQRRGKGRRVDEVATNEPVSPQQRSLREEAKGADFSNFAANTPINSVSPQDQVLREEAQKGSDFSKFAPEEKQTFDPEKANDPLRLKKVALETFEEATHDEMALKRRNHMIRYWSKFTISLISSLIIIGGVGWVGLQILEAWVKIWPFLEPVVMMFRALGQVLGTVFGAVWDLLSGLR